MNAIEQIGEALEAAIGLVEEVWNDERDMVRAECESALAALGELEADAERGASVRGMERMEEIAAIVDRALATETAPNATKTSVANGENCNEKRNKTEESDGS